MDSPDIVEQRIYIGNLPNDAKLAHLISVLPPGYCQSKLEIRHNYDVDKNITSSYAFVNIQGTRSEIKSWCDNASERSLAGNVLQIQFAKLSFLERLKQEVESQKRKKDSNSNNQVNFVSPRVENPNLVRFDSDQSTSSSSEDEDEETTFESKPETVLSAGEEEDDKVPPKSNISSKAEIKRLESLKERSTTHVNQQKIIRMAIKTMAKGPSNKIVFNDSDEENGDRVETLNENDKRKLFDDSDSDNEDNITFSDSKPKSKLIKTKVSAVDERFRMDSRFFDGDEVVNPINNENADSDENEQGKLLRIADSIIDTDPSVRPKLKGMKNVDIVIPTRFNPLEKKHRSLIIKKDDDIINEEATKKPAKVKPFKVDKDRFYEVSDNLKEQFKKNESSGFSLLGLFGGDSDVQKSEESVKNDIKDNLADSKTNKIKMLKNPLDTGVQNFFNVDEHSDNDNEEPVKKKKKGENKITWNEPLFIPLTDPRIEEALKFFNTPRKEPVPHAVLSRDLKIIVKKKYQKNAVKTQLFKTKLGNRRKFQNAKDGDKKKRKLDVT